MSEHPIIFSGPMVRAILDGRKTQTRRVAKTNPGMCPYGWAGDRLWVRETYTTAERIWDDDKSKAFMTPAIVQGLNFFRYRADGEIAGARWRPSIHMPRGASRIALEIKYLRLENLQNIDEEDAEAEGVEKSGGWNADETEYGVNYRIPFSRLWDSINAKRGFGWDTNPRVWVIVFRRLEDR